MSMIRSLLQEKEGERLPVTAFPGTNFNACLAPRRTAQVYLSETIGLDRSVLDDGQAGAFLVPVVAERERVSIRWDRNGTRHAGRR